MRLKQNEPSCKKKELHMNSTSNTFCKKCENFDQNMNFLP